MFDEKDIPKLPYGQGSITIFNDKYLAYKKVIKLPNGKSIRKTVYGVTPRKCMDKMNETEKELFKQHKSANKVILLDGMMDWLENVHKQTIKPQSYQRLVNTIYGQIAYSDIGHMRYQSINSSDIQEMINNTCVSLYFRAGVSIEVICKILGNSREVCEKTYVHFVEEQLQNAASQSMSV